MARLRFERSFERYLLDGERPIFAIHRHWAVMAIPAFWVLLSLTIFGYVLLFTSGKTHSSLSTVSLVPVLVAVIHFAWEILCWRLEWFILTDKRLVLTGGVLDRRTGTMPLAKVTDITYNQPLVGELLRFGTFELESAGQDQAMHEIQYVPRTVNFYRLINAAVHSLQPDERDADLVLPGQPWWGRASLVRVLPQPPATPEGSAGADRDAITQPIPTAPSGGGAPPTGGTPLPTPPAIGGTAPPLALTGNTTRAPAGSPVVFHYGPNGRRPFLARLRRWIASAILGR
jgi:membrane protein YdbS with pleckstrin-like domain